jgi:anti-anti-sigma regulatory factor
VTTTIVDPIVSGGQVLIRLEGDVCDDAVRRLDDQLRATQAQGAPVVLDLRLVTELDDEALWAIAEADRRARTRGARLRMIPGGDAVQHALHAVDLDRRLLTVAPPTLLS